MIIKKIIRRLNLYKDRFIAFLYARKVVYKFEKSWFEGKRVAIVGGAESVLKEKLGNYIDSFDVVVRINRGVEVVDSQKEYVGSRTDFLFHSFYNRENDKGSSPITIDLWKDKGVKHIVFAHNYFYSSYSLELFLDFIRETRMSSSISQIPMDFYEDSILKMRPFCPTTGFLAIDIITKCKPKELYVTGITFFKTLHNQLYRDFNEQDNRNLFEGTSHSPNKEYECFKHMYMNNRDMFILDKTLEEIIHNDLDR